MSTIKLLWIASLALITCAVFVFGSWVEGLCLGSIAALAIAFAPKEAR